MKSKIKTAGDWSLSSPAHVEAMKLGKDYFKTDTANVADRFKGMSVEEINLELRKTANPFAVCFENWIGDFNISTGIRNANAFNAKEVFYIGNRKWDRRGAVGVYNYTDVNWLSSVDEFLALKEKYTIVGVDNIQGSVPMKSYQWQPNTLMVFGEEGVGLTPGMQSLCQDIVAIEMFGSVRSLNCGTASGIVMYDFVSKVTTNGN
jgi:tRNA G18 (ribose-2'-O)-methylase SpoU